MRSRDGLRLAAGALLLALSPIPAALQIDPDHKDAKAALKKIS
jgi:hypothetical protein